MKSIDDFAAMTTLDLLHMRHQKNSWFFMRLMIVRIYTNKRMCQKNKKQKKNARGFYTNLIHE